MNAGVGAINVTVHPHGCGERWIGFNVGQFIVGSSPRLWGTLPVDVGYLLENRFIPTAVGNAGGTVVVFELQSVHPHGCGERLVYVNASTD